MTYKTVQENGLVGAVGAEPCVLVPNKPKEMRFGLCRGGHREEGVGRRELPVTRVLDSAGERWMPVPGRTACEDCTE